MTLTDTLPDTLPAGLLAAIDAGDDTAIPILADFLEEHGDRRAAGLRLVAGRYEPTEFWNNGQACHGWEDVGHGDPGGYFLSPEVFERLPASVGTGVEVHSVWSNSIPPDIGRRVSYRIRSHAFLALAAALVKEPAST